MRRHRVKRRKVERPETEKVTVKGWKRNANEYKDSQIKKRGNDKGEIEHTVYRNSADAFADYHF